MYIHIYKHICMKPRACRKSLVRRMIRRPLDFRSLTLRHTSRNETVVVTRPLAAVFTFYHSHSVHQISLGPNREVLSNGPSCNYNAMVYEIGYSQTPAPLLTGAGVPLGLRVGNRGKYYTGIIWGSYSWM